MDASAAIYLTVALAAVTAAIMGFNALMGRGPRGTMWIVAACLFTWSAALPFVLRDPDDQTLSRQHDLLITILQLAGIVGVVLGLFDMWQQRLAQQRHALAEFLLRQPLVWGTVLCGNFFLLLYQGAFHNEGLARYAAGHPIEIIEVTVFFIGLAALAVRFLDVVGQFPSLRRVYLPAIPAGGQAVADCGQLISQLHELPAELSRTYIVRRLRDAIEFVRRKNSADVLDQHLRHLEELESVHINSGYSMVRVIIWAIPILGLLGTVIGITIAVANLDPQTLEQSMAKVTHGLGVAFDHTATALSLTMLLMFSKSAVERVEDQLLAKVDKRVSEELVGRFCESGESNDPNVAAVRRMSEQVIDAVEALAARQAEVWKSSIDETHQQWADVSVATGHIVKETLSSAIKDNLEQHARVLGQNALKHADRMEASAANHSERVERSAQETAGRLRDGLEKLGALLVEALERHGEVMTTSEKELAEETRQYLGQVEAALGGAMLGATERQEQLIQQSERLLKDMQVALVDAAGATVRQQEQLVRQGDVLLKVVDATGHIKTLEESLNQNLAAVHKTHNFEEMALTLSAAIQLLSARLGHYPLAARNQDIATGPTSQAA